MSTTAAKEPPIRPPVLNTFSSPHGEVKFTAACFEGKDWSLAPMQAAEDAKKHPDFASRLGRAFAGLGAKCVFAPTPTKFNAKIIAPGTLRNIIPLPGGAFLCRNKDVPADGTLLTTAGDAGTFSAGGCGVPVMSYRNRLVFAHAGRECLLDRLWVETEGAERSRHRVSVIDTMLDALDVPIPYLDQVSVWLLYFIKPDEFKHHKDDPAHGEYNKTAMRFLPKMFGDAAGTVTSEYIAIDQPSIAKAQCVRRGISTENIHVDHQYLADEFPTTRNGGGRYLVAIVRN